MGCISQKSENQGITSPIYLYLMISNHYQCFHLIVKAGMMVYMTSLKSNCDNNQETTSLSYSLML